MVYGACAYVSWELKCGGYAVNLIAAKNRIAPTHQVTIPRLELCGAVLATRLRKTIEKVVDWEFDSVFHIVDSTIVRSQIQRETYGFNTFVATKLSENQKKTNPNEWWWIETNQNPADMVTRPCHPNRLGNDSTWQMGPEFMSLPISQWPISQINETELPDRIGITMTLDSTKERDEASLNLIKIERYSNYNKLLRVTYRLMKASKMRSFSGIGMEPTADDMIEAESLWIHEIQKNMSD